MNLKKYIIDNEASILAYTLLLIEMVLRELINEEHKLQRLLAFVAMALTLHLMPSKNSQDSRVMQISVWILVTLSAVGSFLTEIAPYYFT